MTNDAIIIVDLQKGFLDEKKTDIGQRITEMIRQGAKQNYTHRIATQFINCPGSNYVNLLGREEMMHPPDTDLMEGIKENATCVPKYGYGLNQSFWYYANKHGITHFDIVGLETDACVFKIALDLFDANLIPHVIGNCCATGKGQEVHEQSLGILRGLIGEEQVIT